jgi:hypothetical protein
MVNLYPKLFGQYENNSYICGDPSLSKSYKKPSVSNGVVILYQQIAAFIIVSVKK